MQAGSDREFRVLLVEDVPHEAELVIHQLQRAGLRFDWRRVETEEDLRGHLSEFSPDIILSDFNLPQFDGISALRIARELHPEAPFIFVSGTIGEERAIDALRAGAADYVLKNNLLRLAPAVKRALADAELRLERARQEAQIARMARVLGILSGVNSLVVRVRDRKELLQETCRLAVQAGGYLSAVVFAKISGAAKFSAVAWSGADILRHSLPEPADAHTDIVGQIFKTGKVFLCNDPAHSGLPQELRQAMLRAELSVVVGLPLVVDRTPIGALLLAARESDAVSVEELRTLREIAGNLSFALQYLQKDSKVRLLSHFDPRTGLAKRPLFCDRLSRVLADPVNQSARFAVSVIDIERMSLINDSFGRRIGDLLLQHVADRLRSRFRRSERVAHFGGGTFAVFADASSRDGDELLAAMRAHAAALFGRPFVIEQQEIQVTVRSGLALHPNDGRDANALVQHAELALQEARASGARQLNYSAEKHSEMMNRLALEQKLRVALERQQFVLHYQPKVDFQTRQICGAEALLRWQDPQAGLISPGAFLPVLESTGLIVEVGRWVIEQAARDCQAWLQAGLPPVRIAVNISPLQLRQAEFTSQFLEATGSWATVYAGVDVEITEGALQGDSGEEITRLEQLRSRGAKIAIDDFGTGYSSLSRLSSLPVDTLKIDRSFVMKLPQSAQGITLVQTVVSLAQAFSMHTVAEGVETREQFDMLLAFGCTQSQGYLHSKPLPAAEFVALLRDGRGDLTRPGALFGPG
ncbi:MAG TPA: EAL domain-containing protein [Steroidobacteraceae bacterium]|jgi:diguanylate cyclase (GGDEF)-like protein|nr:EAL domain-containing protein [Steroidobacteraceae bacterium]